MLCRGGRTRTAKEGDGVRRGPTSLDCPGKYQVSLPPEHPHATDQGTSGRHLSTPSSGGRPAPKIVRGVARPASLSLYMCTLKTYTQTHAEG